MNRDSTTTLQKGNHRSLSPVHIHLTDTTPLHVHLKKPSKPVPVHCRNSQMPNNVRNISQKNVSTNQNNIAKRSKFNDKNGIEKLNFGKSYEEETEKPDEMEFPPSQKIGKDKESLLEEYKRRLDVSEMENRKLVQNMEEICLDLESGGMNRGIHDDVNFLNPDLERLKNSQHFLQSMAVKMDNFGSLLRHLREDRIPSISNAELDAILTQKKILERDLVTFDDVCIFLKREMRKIIGDRVKVKEMVVEKEELLGRLNGLKEAHELLMRDFSAVEHRAKEAIGELDNYKTDKTQSNTIVETLRMTKAHLQRELANKEGECNKLSVKVKELQSSLDREKAARERADQDKESLKKATRLHKNKAVQNAKSMEDVNKSLLSKDAEIKQLAGYLDSMRLQLSQVATEKLALSAELNEVKLKLVPSKSLKPKRRSSKEEEEDHDDDDDDIDDDDDYADDFEDGRGEEKEHLKKNSPTPGKRKSILKSNTSSAGIETRATHSGNETGQLKLKVREFENLLDEYKEQVTSSRREAERFRAQVEELKHQLSVVTRGKDFETSKLLKQSELYDGGRLLNDVNLNNNNNCNEGSRLLLDRIEQLDKRIITLEDENKELAILNAKREEALHQTNMRLEEKLNENSNLQRHVDSLMGDMRRTKDSEKDRIAAAERSCQIHILELEGQISQLKHDIDKLRREKDEIERQLNQKLYDLQDELKQSHSTNRALQNFIHFLKSSYNATFDQPTMAAYSSIPNLISMGR